jgi:two-component system chemotaxis response regulator CheB
MAKNIRVLVVDDSAVIRERIADYIREAPGIEVAGKAANGRIALGMLENCAPDIVTLDVQMPEMDGLDTLDAILARRPLPVIMVSALTQRGADVTLKALDRGALDYVGKPENNAGVEAALRDELLHKIRTMAGADVPRMLRIRAQRAARRNAQALRPTRPIIPAAAATEAGGEHLADKCIAVGISTGGPAALAILFEGLRLPLPPIVIVQHMPADFTKAFAWRLNSNSAVTVKEAETGDVLKPNHAYVAPGGRHLTMIKQGRDVKLHVRDGAPVSGHKPSVDVMMRCAADVFGADCLGVVMTGMGRDGSDGCRFIRAAGGYVLGQDEASSDVYGMNKVALVEGNVDRQFGLDEAASLLALQVRRQWGRGCASV